LIGSLGRLEPRKGHDTLIRAMPAILARVPDACLLIAGHDPWRYGKTLQALIDDLGLKDRARLVGFQADVSSFFHALDVFAFASRAEGFGQVLIEVMDAGRPVVASRIAPLTEIVEDRLTGLLVAVDDPQAFADGIVSLLGDSARRRRMGEAGRRRIREQFSAETMARRTVRLYESLLARNRVP
jgi:glycosyltransferase involved in cell wall biosynthesis